MKIRSLVTFGLSASLLMACNETKQLHEMHDNTAQMNDTTGKMAKTTDKMADTTDKVSKTSDEMNAKMSSVEGKATDSLEMMAELYDSARQGAGFDLRKKIFQSMMADQALDKKIVDAGEYYLAFEFELWSGLGQDKESKQRDALANDAVLELFNHLKTVSNWDDKDLDPFANPATSISPELLSKTNEKAVFNALSAALHKTNRKQERATGINKVETLSMFSLIERALLAGQEIKAGTKHLEDFPEYINEVLKSEPLAIRLLKARFNIMGVILLGRTTDLTHSLWQGAKITMLNQKWTMDLDSLEISQVLFYTAHLTEAQKAKDLLEKVGIKIELDSSLQKVFSKMILKDSKNANELFELRTAKDSFIEALTRYQGKP